MSCLMVTPGYAVGHTNPIALPFAQIEESDPQSQEQPSLGQSDKTISNTIGFFLFKQKKNI